MSSKKSAGGLIIGFVLGAVAGLALALLFTPKPGKQTRGLIKDQVNEITTTIRDQTADRQKIYKETWKTRKGQPKISPGYFE